MSPFRPIALALSLAPAVFLGACRTAAVASLTPLSIDGKAVGAGITSGQVDLSGRTFGSILLPVSPQQAGSLAEAVTLAMALQPGFGIVPGVNQLNWNDLKEIPYAKRDEFDRQLDTAIGQLRGAVEIARLSPPKPGQEAAHAAAIAVMEESLRELTRQRFLLDHAEPGGWEFAKDQIRSAWQQSENSYLTARVSGF